MVSNKTEKEQQRRKGKRNAGDGNNTSTSKLSRNGNKDRNAIPFMKNNNRLGIDWH